MFSVFPRPTLQKIIYDGLIHILKIIKTRSPSYKLVPYLQHPISKVMYFFRPLIFNSLLKYIMYSRTSKMALILKYNFALTT